MSLSESDLQRAVVSWAGTMVARHPELEWLYAVPNGGYRSGREAVGLRAQGVRAGILDLALDVARCGYHGLRIELKKPVKLGVRQGRLSKEQLLYMDFLKTQGYLAVCLSDFEAVKSLVLGYLENRLIGCQG